MQPKIGIGVVTFNRPDYLEKCLASIEKHLKDVVDVIWVVDDGSKVKQEDCPFNYHWKKNEGVGKSKNWLFKKLLAEGCDYIFICENDMIIKSPKAVTEYVRLSELSGIEHFNFAHHGPANIGKLEMRANGVDVYGNPVGAWCMYSARVLNEVGLMDENFHNAWEHVFHTWLISLHGYTTPWPYAACDITGSQKYITEIPGSIENTSIKHTKKWLNSMINGLIYWKNKDPRDFPLTRILDSLLAEEAAVENK